MRVVLTKQLKRYRGILISLVIVSGIIISCSQIGEIEVPRDPVQRDLSEILAGDTLRVITRNHPLTYYLYRGTRRGFDFELIKKFAEEKGIVVEAVIPPRWVDMIPYLYEGRGDLIASMMTITPERDALVGFTRPYLEVWQVVVGTEQNPPPVTLDELNGIDLLVRAGSSYDCLLYTSDAADE